MNKVILYYLFTPISDPQTFMLWQKNLCQRLELKGRIIISKHGINGTLGGDIEKLKEYIKENKSFDPFRMMVYKWSDGTGKDFPRLSVKVRSELVTFDAADEIKVNKNGVIGGGKHLKPNEVHQLIEEKGEDEVVFFDGRNLYETKVGKFKNARVSNARTAKDFIPEIESGKFDDLKDKSIITYCTGGVRCEILSALMKKRGFKDVYQIDGGILKYANTYKDDALWEGSLYVFDGRMEQNFSKNTKVIGECIHCKTKTSNYENCANKACNDLVLICENCKTEESKLYHSNDCKITLAI